MSEDAVTGLTDTHCHIQSAGSDAGEEVTRQLWAKSPELNGDIMIQNAIAAGVTRLICVGCELEDSINAIAFVQGRDNCWATIGLHPHEAQHYAHDKSKQDKFRALASKPKVVAIGECGLDFYYTHSPKADQIAVLKFQIELALGHGLPMIFHVRDAFDDFWPVFDQYKGIRGVLHSFTDSAENLAKAMERNLYIGVNGIATFTKDEAQRDVYKSIPLQKLLLETDAPFLTPTPYRGSINEPGYVSLITRFMAELRGENLEDLAKSTTDNARQLFGI